MQHQSYKRPTLGTPKLGFGLYLYEVYAHVIWTIIACRGLVSFNGRNGSTAASRECISPAAANECKADILLTVNTAI